jgi:cell pole-organizing protein PopZ
MTDKNEMSLDDVLSSIKRMVIDDEPPVLDLTDMLKPDGTIVKIASTDPSENQDIGTFLKLAQKNAESMSEIKREKEGYAARQLQKAPLISADILSCPVTSRDERPKQRPSEPNKKEEVLELLKEVATPLIDKWLEDNLPKIVQKTVEEKLRELGQRVFS